MNGDRSNSKNKLVWSWKPEEETFLYKYVAEFGGVCETDVENLSFDLM